MCELILASKSPRRHELLKHLGHKFTVIESGIEENSINGETPAEHVTRLSEMKAKDVGSRLTSGIVIGSDTVVVMDDEILGKPDSQEKAVEMIMHLQGRTHKVYTGFALYDVGKNRIVSDYEVTEVTMHNLDRELAERYVGTGEPMDKAGSYGIQGFGSTLVKSIKGCYFTVMGLPLSKLMKELHSFSKGRYGYFGSGMESNT